MVKQLLRQKSRHQPPDHGNQLLDPVLRSPQEFYSTRRNALRLNGARPFIASRTIHRQPKTAQQEVARLPRFI